MACKNRDQKSNVPNANADQKISLPHNQRDSLGRPSIVSTTDWLMEAGLQQVESVLYDTQNKALYASNGKDYKVGNDGFISKISANGDLLQLKWVVDLNRPTGMALFENMLYIADVNQLVVIDTQTGNVLKKMKSPIENAGLNDVAITEKGDVYVTASFVHAVFKVVDGALKTFVKDEESLQWANGIIAKDGLLWIAGLNLCTVVIETKEIKTVKLTPEVEDFDGICSDGGQGFFLTTVSNRALWHLNGSLQMSNLKDGKAYFGDLDYVQSHKSLYIPRGIGESGKFYISKYLLD